MCSERWGLSGQVKHQADIGVPAAVEYVDDLLIASMFECYLRRLNGRKIIIGRVGLRGMTPLHPTRRHVTGRPHEGSQARS